MCCRKPSIRYKVHREGVCTPKHNNKEEKESLAAFHDTVPALSVILKKKFLWKNGIFYKTNRYFAKFLKNHLSFPTRKENP